MPIINITHTEGAVAEGAVPGLVARVLEAFVAHHVDRRLGPELERVTMVTVSEMPRGRVFVGRAEAEGPRYVVELVVPGGSVRQESVPTMAEALTAAVLAGAGRGGAPRGGEAVWVSWREVPEGRWAVDGVVVTLRAVVGHLVRSARARAGASGGRARGLGMGANEGA